MNLERMSLSELFTEWQRARARMDAADSVLALRPDDETEEQRSASAERRAETVSREARTRIEVIAGVPVDQFVRML